MDNTYVVFGHRGARYALHAHAVREIVWLPELSLIEELPQHFVGVFNLRGRVLPVMDLALRFGHAREGYRLSDRIVVVETEAARVGIVVNELYDVATIPHAAIEGIASYQGLGARAQFVCGEAKLGGNIVMLLYENALIQSRPDEEVLARAEPRVEQKALTGTLALASAEESQVFRERAQSLAREPRADEPVGQSAYGIIGLGGELFGLPVGVVREFVHAKNVSPVPCCPPHIVGNINLRGDILTIVDIRPALGIPIQGEMAEVVVVRVGDLLLGVPAAEIVDVVNLGREDIVPVPVASDGEGKAFSKGVATVGSRTISILDMEKILAGRELKVVEQVQ